MILIVDSGSTKTDWIAIDNLANNLFSTQTLGSVSYTHLTLPTNRIV